MRFDTLDGRYNRVRDNDGDVLPMRDTGFRYTPRPAAPSERFTYTDVALVNKQLDLANIDAIAAAFHERLLDRAMERLLQGTRSFNKAAKPSTESIPAPRKKATKHEDLEFTLSTGETLRACHFPGCKFGQPTGRGGWRKHSDGMPFALPDAPTYVDEGIEVSPDDVAELNLAPLVRVAGEDVADGYEPESDAEQEVEIEDDDGD